jgi:hypothetical protein
MTRTNGKHVRIYVDGYDMSGHARKVGPLGATFDAMPDAAFTDGSKNVLIGQGMVTAGPINAMFDNTAATGFHTVLSAQPTSPRVVTIAQGVGAAPVAGDPVFSWKLEQQAYQAEQGTGFVGVNLMTMPAAIGSGYYQPWGVLLHASGAETAANTATGIDDFGAATANGGIFVAQLLSSDGTVTLTAQDAATNSNGSFAAITGATTGSIDATVTPVASFVLLTEGSAVRRYLRWQLALGTATTATFVMALIRHYGLT